MDNLYALRDQYKHITGLLGNANDVQVKTGEFIFTDLNQPIMNDYERVMEQYYDVDILPIDYTKLKEATIRINSYIRNATNNQIPKAVHPNDIINSKVILVSTLFFQGQWTVSYMLETEQVRHYCIIIIEKFIHPEGYKLKLMI